MSERRHRWHEVYRDVRKTERECEHCEIVKVTRHEPGADPPHWIEFWRGLERIEGPRTPACESAS